MNLSVSSYCKATFILLLSNKFIRFSISLYWIIIIKLLIIFQLSNVRDHRAGFIILLVLMSVSAWSGEVIILVSDHFLNKSLCYHQQTGWIASPVLLEQFFSLAQWKLFQFPGKQFCINPMRRLCFVIWFTPFQHLSL